MIKDAHLLEHAQVKLVVVLGELAKADGTVLVDDASDLEHGARLAQRGVALEFDDFYWGVYV